MPSKSINKLIYQLNKPQNAVEKYQRDKVILDCKELGIGYSLFFIMGCSALYGYVPTYLLIIASLMIVAEAIIKISLVYKYKAQNGNDRAKPYWRYVIWMGGLYTGIFFGVAALALLLPLPKPNASLFLFTYAGIYVTSCWLGSYYMPTAVLKLVPLTLPLAIALVLQGPPLHILMSTTLVFTTVISIFYVYGLTKQFAELNLANIRIEELNQRLSAEKQSAEQAVLDKSSFIAAASHDLRQPLHALGLFLGAIRNHSDDKKIHSLMDSAEKSTSALKHLFEGLLDVSKLDAGAVEPRPTHIKFSSLTSSLEDEFQELAKSKGLSLTIVDSSCVVYTDVFLLERVLRNLLGNAIAYTNQGSVSLKAIRFDDQIEITVTDTGIGIPDSELETIFSEFHQIEKKEPYAENGFGLGLAIVDRISRLLDYDLSVNSSLGQGTTFTIVVPEGEINNTSEPLISPVLQTIQTGTKILFIDDNDGILDGLDAAMDGWNTENLFVRSYDEAIRSMNELDFVPDLIICDHHLKNSKHGADAALKIREKINRNIPFIIITGDTAIKDIGMTPPPPILYKPVRPQELCEAIVLNLK